MEYDAQETKAKFKQPSVGTHTAVCFMVADVGTQITKFENEDPKPTPQIMLGWELPEELTEDGKPMIVYKTYTLSFNEKASLAIHYKAWMKEPNATKFNLSKLIGAGCNLTIGRTTGDNAKVVSVSALKASEKVPLVTNGKLEFYLKKPDPLALDYLPKFIVEKIEASPEWKAYKASALAGDSVDAPDKKDVPFNDSIPF